MNFEIWEETDGTRVLYLHDVTQEEMDDVQGAIDNLYFACEEYIASDSPHGLNKNVYEAAIGLSIVLDAEVAQWNNGLCNWYVVTDDYRYDDYPVVWVDSSDELWAVEVRGSLIEDNRPSLWSWESSNGIASDEQTSLAYKIVYDGYDGIELTDIYNFHHNVWNDLVNKVLETRLSHHSSWYTIDDNGNVYLSYDDTLMGDSEEERVLTADKFNAVRFNVGMSEPTGISPNDIETGKVIKGEYFLKLTEALNRFIEKL